MPTRASVSPLTLNRLSLYLRCLKHLQEQGLERVSSQDLAGRFNLSATQIRKDLAQFGEFGIRGIGYEVEPLIERLRRVLGQDRRRSIVVAGMGNLGSAVARYLGFNQRAFKVVAGVDADPEKVGQKVGDVTVHHISELKRVVADTGAEIGVLAVPASQARACYELMVEAGVQAILNFAPVRLPHVPEVPTKNVDLRVYLEELGFLLHNQG